jgi:hypothetical protein
MDIGKAFSFVFEDKDWVVKILIAAAILLGGILFFWLLLIPLILAIALVAGYAVEITRRVIKGHPQPLPEWDNWGALLADGLKAIVIAIVYALPFVIISACLGAPAGVLGEGGDVAQVFAGLFGALAGIVNLLWLIAWFLLFPAALAFYVVEEDLSAAFRFGKVLNFVRDNIKTYLIVMVMSWVARVVSNLGLFVCGLGWLVTFPYSWMLMGHLYGQAYLEAAGAVAEPVVLDVEEIA